ncbi:hypothetical protein LbFV_ORF77 [Leptopilina boulardi filamentous virus]|uniref:Uncharacterized protein n=1 Tax=Leptopilina boulardi filamentous virus TaxID=552509 RepID=A0A1S5YDC2_9VIRU|nr:hypothetical protein LbFV_ORF77 [Leptopilina boulardi filamentous virus]AQQ79997.1 hypothetical protein LbFV_ORF77 [Leptopilina boulardi filamentous virus]
MHLGQLNNFYNKCEKYLLQYEKNVIQELISLMTFLKINNIPDVKYEHLNNCNQSVECHCGHLYYLVYEIQNIIMKYDL